MQRNPAPPRRPASGTVRRTVLGAAAAGLFGGALTGCSGRADGAERALRVAYPFWGEDDIVHRQMRACADAFAAARTGRPVELIPIPDQQGNFATKIELMQRSATSAPDVVFQDTVMTNADVQAGYLRPLDAWLRAWPDWRHFNATAREATRADDGRTYGVLTGTDVRAILYDRRVFAAAGLPSVWRPRDWNDLLGAARIIRRRVRGAVPLNVYATKALGEATTTQGLLMLLYGTDDGFHDEKSGLWKGDTPGLRASLSFVDAVFREELGPTRQMSFSPTARDKLVSELLPAGKVGIAVGEGSWTPKTWIEGGASPWPGWTRHIGVAAMPARHGPGRVSLSGGWMLSVGAHSAAPEAAFRFIAYATGRERALRYAVENAQIPVREDVLADPAYTEALPTNETFAKLLSVTEFRPTQAEYLMVSSRAQVAMEDVMTGKATPARAARTYADGLRDDLGEDRVVDRG
ncbi:extracellular solute-binding protein [Streptomyces tubbatahanensis]|uniref:Extracellular solute-binding protein n=1 Tax=Streptomyces tubbatahanensis TaxID=2923272 RepID=A0ABY3XZT9_9ACTN|nr:extracellular solute-binding protein [Streptomyces tubbatahanensis]UNT00066.1 extracellular solute-binding protein [Streptomyces tubbatahanensis]